MKSKSTRKGRKKSFLALCLAVAMAFCYNVPIIAESYEINPDYENDTDWDDVASDTEKPDGVSFDEDLIGKIVYPEDYFILNNLKEGKTYNNEAINAIVRIIFSADFDGQVIEITEDDFLENRQIGICYYDENDKAYCHGDYESDDYKNYLKKDDTFRAWKVEDISPDKVVSGGYKMMFYVDLVAVDTYKINYHFDGVEVVSDGGYFTPEEDKDLEAVKDVVPEGVEIPNGKAYIGWYDNEDFEGDPITTIEAGTIEEDVDLYAKLDYIDYDIVYNTNGGEFVEGYVAPETYTIEDEVILPAKDDITCDGAEFLGWYDNENLEGDPITKIKKGSTGKQTFYAKFKAHEYKASGDDEYQQGSNKGYVITVSDADKDAVKDVYVNDNKVDPEDYTVTEKDGSVIVTISPDLMDDLDTGDTVITILFKDGIAELTVDVIEEEIPEQTEYKVTFVTNNGGFKLGYDVPEKYTVADGLVLPTKDNIALMGNEFLGWYTKKNLSGDPVTEIAAGTKGDKTFYAKFAPHKYDVEADDEYQQGSGDDYVMHILGVDKEALTGVSVARGNVDLTKLKVTDGSTIITFDSEFMDGLAEGETDIRADFLEGYAGLTLKVLKADTEDTEDTENTENTEDTGGTQDDTTEAGSDDPTEDSSEDTSGSGELDVTTEGSGSGSEDVTEDESGSKAQDASVEEGSSDDSGNAAGAATNETGEVKTGDDFNLNMAVMMLAISVIGAAVTLFLKRKKKSDK